MIPLGYEVGTGKAVAVPLKHLAVTGQTQESGKTTTLEALVSRSGVAALAFVTKRGESSFTKARRIAPYFRDRADWQFVSSIIDATLQEKNKFLRPWIMRICRTTRTLRDVQTAIRRELRTAKGIHEGVYTQLDAYLDLIVPEIDRAPLAPSLDLAAGLNVMDVSASPIPMQMLFVQSALDWVNDHATNTIVIVPEAWEFVPEGKGSPCKASAVALVRKGAGIGNHIWIDSQDMAGVDKVILRGCAVWLIGVQREANEIKRNLSNIPANIKRPTAADVAMLGRGQFYACWSEHAVKVYVQPAWMDEVQAQAIATNRATVPTRPITKEEETVTPLEAQALRDENARLRERIAALEHAQTPPPPSPRPSADHSSNGAMDDAAYEALKARLLREPAVLRVLAQQPELRVEVERVTLTADGASLKGRVARLLASGFYDDGRTNSATRKELARTGSDANNAAIANVLSEFVALGFLTREAGDSFTAVKSMKVSVIER